MTEKLTDKFICIHCHFYQPPRENPWLEKVELQDSAYPFHDWNEKITAECYAPNSAARIVDTEGRIVGLINNYSRISFNFGPTVLYWLLNHNPDVYQAIIDADKKSAKSFSGHGSAIAQPYNHMIMPLANKRDKETQVKWGIKDFESKFGRSPEGMWLPETAVDTETLETLAENNIKFTILSPHQAAQMRKIGSKDWVDISEEKLDPRKAYICKLPSGKSISLFFYDKIIATDAAFGSLLGNGEAFAKRLIDAFKDSKDSASIVSLASDGELYGHHHKQGDMTLAYCLHYLEANNLAKITNYAEFLEKNPPEYEVKIQENTSWSCRHGVERWKNDCGDTTSSQPGWKQQWRKPLREAMDWLRDTLSPKFEQVAREYFKDPWQTRNDYIEVINNRSKENIEKFLNEHANKSLNEDEKRRAIKLLEMQRHTMLMFTSCGWFFSEVSGTETVQVMAYAARAIQLSRELFGVDLEKLYVDMLAQASSNISEFGNGAFVFDRFVRPQITDLMKIAAQQAILWLFPNKYMSASASEHQQYCCFKITGEQKEIRDAGKFRAVVGRSKVYSETTLDEASYGCAAIWLGDHNISCGVMHNMSDEAFNSMRNELFASFEKGDINETILLISKHFESNHYSLKDLFRDDQLNILGHVTSSSIRKATEFERIVYQDNSAMLRFLKENYLPQPEVFHTAAKDVLNKEMARMLSYDKLNLQDIEKLVSEAKLVGIKLDSAALGLQASKRIEKEIFELSKNPQNIEEIENMEKLIINLKEASVNLNLWSAQNIMYKIAESDYKSAKEKGDEQSLAWTKAFKTTSALMGIKLD